MVILGLSDGARPCAAVVRDDRLVAVESSLPTEASGALPLPAARRALAAVGLSPADVTVAALAGRYSPPLRVRRSPRLRGWAADPFSGTRAVSTRAERFLRGTGLGAADADRARDWLGDALGADGYAPRKVVLIDIHKALASSVYRTSAVDRATIVVVQPDGDGVLASVHRAVAGQIDRVSADRATTGAHLFLSRALSVLDVPDLPALATLAGDAEPDAAVRASLHDVVSYMGRFRGRPGPERRGEPPWSSLRRNRPAGAAAVVAHLRELTGELVSHHHLDEDLLVAGAWFSDLGVLGLADPVVASRFRGDEALAVGAAVDAAGLTPSPQATALGAPVEPGGDGPESVAPESVAAVIASGGAWVRCRSRGTPGALSAAHRGVWVRADDPRAVARARELLEVPATTPTTLLTASPPPQLPRTLLPSWASGVTLDGRTFVGPGEDEVLLARLRALAAEGVDGIALFPWSSGARPRGQTLADARAIAKALRGSLEWSDRFEPRPA